MVILDELKNITGFLNSPEPQVLFHTFGASSIDLNVFFWVDTSITSPLIAKDEALTLIKNAFEKKKIEIPYPIQMQIDRKTSTSKRKTK
jgi:small-conductance mechanosensitive channel